jgi:predicted nuclease of predicted toxin-antitoxin system
VTLYRPRLLIDECLSPELVPDMRDRGFICGHANDVKAKRREHRLSDPNIARYALERDMIVVTRNISDFLQLYQARSLHPGLVLLRCPEGISFSVPLQRSMLALAIDGRAEKGGTGLSEPLQEVVTVSLVAARGGEFELALERSFLPAV